VLLKLTTHAQLRLQERGFTVEKLKQVLSRPDKIEKSEDGIILKAWKRLGDGTELKVVYKKDNFRDKKNEYIIITAFFMNKK